MVPDGGRGLTPAARLGCISAERRGIAARAPGRAAMLVGGGVQTIPQGDNAPLNRGVDACYKQAKNLIDEGPFGAPIILTAFNYARAQVDGVEFSATYEDGPWSLYGNLAYSRAIGKNIVSSQFDFSAADLAYISQHCICLDHDQRWTSSAGAAYLLNAGTSQPTRLSADAFSGSGLRAGTATVPNGRGLPTDAVINPSIVQRLDLGVGRGTEARLDVLNVPDHRYEIRDGTGVGVGAP